VVETVNADSRDRDRIQLEVFEVSLRNIARPWQAAAEVANRLSRQPELEALTAPLGGALQRCAPAALIAMTAALRAALEDEAR
jgi:hypothetical protein